MTSTSTPSSKQPLPRQRKNTLSIIIHATMQLLSSPPSSPTDSTVNGAIISQSSFSSTSRDDSSEYFSFPDYETYIKDVEETEKMVVQMEEFDEMVVNGVRIRSPKN
uniref:Accessory gene regulator protein B n=1 Tax=Anthurium amnicola TaxID=1678845 RepID=A0A1D1YCL8_9ARAE